MRLSQKQGFQLQVRLVRVTAAANADVGVTGSAGTGALNSVTVQGAANVPQTGISATGGVGSVTIDAWLA